MQLLWTIHGNDVHNVYKLYLQKYTVPISIINALTSLCCTWTNTKLCSKYNVTANVKGPKVAFFKMFTYLCIYAWHSDCDGQSYYMAWLFSSDYLNYISFLNRGWPTRWHLLYYILLNMFQTLIRPSSGASEHLLCCVGWLEACWCYVAGSAYTRIPHHQQTIPLHNTNTPQVSVHNTTSTR